jgi:hypothetical protein
MIGRTASSRPGPRGVQTPLGSQLSNFSFAIACCCTSAASTCSTERPFSISSRAYRECPKRRYDGVGWRKLKRAKASNPESSTSVMCAVKRRWPTAGVMENLQWCFIVPGSRCIVQLVAWGSEGHANIVIRLGLRSSYTDHKR